MDGREREGERTNVRENKCEFVCVYIYVKGIKREIEYISSR